jgi:hypothetical protein
MDALYRSLLRLYPAGVRQEFGEEMLSVARQARAAVWGNGMVARANFCAREVLGLLAGAAREQVRVVAGFETWTVSRRFSVRSNFRYPVATIVLMAVIFAGTVVAIEKASSIAVALPRVNPQLPPIPPLPYSLPQTLAVMFALTYAAAVVIWAVLHALRRSGVHRLHDAETWPQK